MSAPEPTAVERTIADELIANGAAPGGGIHSWRCEYPDRYGPCDCVNEVARDIAAAIRKMPPTQMAELNPYAAGHIKRKALREAARDLDRRADEFRHLPGDKHIRKAHHEIAKWLRARAREVRDV